MAEKIPPPDTQPVKWVNRRGRLVGLDADGRAVAVQKRAHPHGNEVIDWPYWEPRLVRAWSQGDKSWAEICAALESEGCPPYRRVVERLLRHPAFAERARDTRKTRALLFEDKIVQIAEGEYGEKEAAGARVKLDAYKYLAKVNDRDTYGDSTKLTGSLTVGPTLVDTGIRREGDPGFVPSSAALPLPGSIPGEAQAAINEGAAGKAGEDAVEDEG